MNKSVCVIPCFNEGDNLLPLCREVENFNNKNIDWYFINNGSIDMNSTKFNSIIKENTNSSNIFIYTVHRNKGVGYGIKTCLLEIINDYEVLSWTHADGQTPIEDVIKANKIYFSNKNKDVVKGYRSSRSDGLIASLFTSLYNLILLLSGNHKSRSPNSQPTLIKSSLAKKILHKAENDANFDISVLLSSNNKNANIIRFPVQFKSRISGQGTNELILDKIKYSYKTLCFLMKRQKNNKK